MNLMATKAERIGVVLAPTRGAWDGKSTAAPIVWKDDAGYHMLYQGWSRGHGPRILGLAESRNGLDWAKYKGNPVMKQSEGSWDQGGFECGCLALVDSEYRLYYTGIGGDGKARIGLAVSTDLRTWEKHKENPILEIEPTNPWESRGAAFPAVVRGTDEHGMIYGGYGPESMQLGLATSEDGVHWTRHPHNPVFRQRGWFMDPTCRCWDAGIEVHQTISVGDHFVMFYEGLGNYPHRYNIGVAYSPDCEVWARSPENPIFPLTSPSVKQDMSTVHPWLLLDDMLLFYVEVVGASTEAEHRICAARVRPELTSPLAQKALSYPLAVDRVVGPAGVSSPSVACMGFATKTFFLTSSKPGTVRIEVDPSGLGQWSELHGSKVRAGGLWSFESRAGFERARLRFVPSARSRVSAWLVLEKG